MRAHTDGTLNVSENWKIPKRSRGTNEHNTRAVRSVPPPPPPPHAGDFRQIIIIGKKREKSEKTFRNEMSSGGGGGGGVRGREGDPLERSDGRSRFSSPPLFVVLFFLFPRPIPYSVPSPARRGARSTSTRETERRRLLPLLFRALDGVYATKAINRGRPPHAYCARRRSADNRLGSRVRFDVERKNAFNIIHIKYYRWRGGVGWGGERCRCAAPPRPRTKKCRRRARGPLRGFQERTDVTAVYNNIK